MKLVINSNYHVHQSSSLIVLLLCSLPGNIRIIPALMSWGHSGIQPARDRLYHFHAANLLIPPSLDEPLKFLFLLICCSSHIPSGRSWAIPSLSWAHHLGCAGGDAAVKGARAGDTQTVEPGHHGQVPKATGACVELEWPEWTPGSQSLVDSSSMKQQWGGKSIFLLARRSV